VRALELYERLYGPPNAVLLLDKLAAMDAAFGEYVASEAERKREKTSKGR